MHHRVGVFAVTDNRTVTDDAVGALAARIAHDMAPLEGWAIKLSHDMSNAGYESSSARRKSNAAIEVENEGSLSLLLEILYAGGLPRAGG